MSASRVLELKAEQFGESVKKEKVSFTSRK